MGIFSLSNASTGQSELSGRTPSSDCTTLAIEAPPICAARRVRLWRRRDCNRSRASWPVRSAAPERGRRAEQRAPISMDVEYSTSLLGLAAATCRSASRPCANNICQRRIWLRGTSFDGQKRPRSEASAYMPRYHRNCDLCRFARCPADVCRVVHRVKMLRKSPSDRAPRDQPD